MKRAYIISLACTALLSACGGGVKETLGINRKAPDEFKVVARPPLSVPPEFSLTPPTKGEDVSAVSSADKEAQSLLFGHSTNGVAADGGSGVSGTEFSLKAGSSETAVTPVETNALATNAEDQFLKNAGAENASSSVRSEIYEETAVKKEKEDDTWHILTTLPEKGEPVVDAKGEKERITKNKAEGKPVTEGETPQEKPRDTGVLGRLLGN